MMTGGNAALAENTATIGIREPILSLSVDEIITLCKNLNLPPRCDHRELIDGRVLNEVESLGTVNGLGFSLPPLKARVLLRTLLDSRAHGGVPAELLQCDGILQQQPLSMEEDSSLTEAPPSKNARTGYISSSVRGAVVTVATNCEATPVAHIFSGKAIDVDGISDALSTLLVNVDELHSKFSVAGEVFDAIQTFIGSNDGSEKKMKALGASKTRVIENLKKLLNHLTRLASRPSYSVSAVLNIFVKLLLAIQKVMRYDNDDVNHTNCPINLKLCGNIGLCEELVESTRKLLLILQQQRQQDMTTSSASTSAVALIECCCKTIFVVAENNDNCRKFGAAGVCQVLVDVLKAYGRTNAAVAEMSCKAIWGVTCDEGTMEKFGQDVPGSCQELVHILKTHGCIHVNVAEACCDVIENIADVDEDENKEVLGKAGCIEALVKVLEAFGRTNVALAKACCRAISQVTCRNSENAASFGKVTGACSLLVDVLREYGTADANFARDCCMIICDATQCGGYEGRSSDSLDNKVRFGSTDVFSTILDVLKTHCPYKDRQIPMSFCFNAIISLCDDYIENKQRFVALNAVEVIKTQCCCVGVEQYGKDDALKALL